MMRCLSREIAAGIDIGPQHRKKWQDMNMPKLLLPALALMHVTAAPLRAQSGLISISPVRMVEGNAGTTAVLVPVYLSAAAVGPVSVAWATADGTALAGTDYTAASGTVTFAPGEVFKTLPITVSGDVADEADEVLQVLLSAPAGATLGNAAARVLIRNDEPVTVVSLPQGAQWFEKDLPGFTRPQALVANHQPGKTATLALTSGTATPGTDVVLASTTLSLGSQNPVLPVRPVDDVLSESPETFFLEVVSSSPSVRTVPNVLQQTLPSGPVPKAMELDGDLLAVADGSNVRILRQSGGAWANETSLAGTPEGGVHSVAVDQGLIAADFLSTGVRVYEKSAGTWTAHALIPRTTTPADARRVVALGDDLLAVGDPAATGQTTVSGEVRVYERHRGGRNAWGLRQALTPPTVQPDFGTSVAVWGNFIAAGAPESSSLSLFRRDATTGAWTRIRELTAPFYSGFGRYCALDGDNLVTTTDYYLHSSRRSDAAGLTWSDWSGTSVSNTFTSPRCVLENGHVALNTYGGVILFARTSDGVWNTAGTSSEPYSEPQAPFAMQDGQVISVGQNTGTAYPLKSYRPGPTICTLLDDDSVRFTVSSQSIVEGTSFNSITVQLSAPQPVAVYVLVTTVDGTATAGSDYLWQSQWVYFNEGATSGTFYIDAYADGLTEGTETLQVVLEFPTVGSVGPPGTISITDPPPPTISMAVTGAAVTEGNAGTTTLQLSAWLNRAAFAGTSVDWTLESGTAQAGTDFPAVSGTVIVPAGTTSVDFQIPVNGDILCEPEETFTVRLTNPVNLVIGAGTTQVTIMNDDTGTPQPDSYTTPQATVLSGRNVRDNDCSALPVTLAQTTAYGTLVLNSSGAFVYTPQPNFIGTDSFSYLYTGSGGGAGTDVVADGAAFRWFNPLDGVDPATADDEWNTGWYTPSWNDSAWGTGNGLMGYGEFTSSQGTLFPNTNIGTPVSGMRRSAYFRHQFNSAQGGTRNMEISLSRDDAAIVYINGSEVLRSHEAGAVAILTQPDRWDLMIEGNNTAWTSSTNEGDAYTHTLTGVNLNAGVNTLAISSHNSLNPSAPTSSDLGVRVFYLRVLSAPPSPIPAAITVTDALLPPVLTADAYTLPEDNVLDTAAASRPSLLANDRLFDNGGAAFDPILEIAAQDELHGTVSGLNSTTGHFIFTPAANFSGTASFRYRVRDKDGWSAPVLVNITVADDFVLSPLVRLQPEGSQLFRSITSSVTLPAVGVADAALALKAGQTISLRSAAAGTVGRLELRSAAGAVLPGGNPGPNSLENVPVPADGVYVIAAGEVTGSGAGGFTILVNGGLPGQPLNAFPYQLENARPAGSLRAAVSATMPAAGAGAHYYQFQGTAGEQVHPALFSGPVQSFTLLDAGGTTLAASSASPHHPAAASLSFSLPGTGTYRLMIPGVNGADYTLQLYRGPASHEYATASPASLEQAGAGFLLGPGGAETGVTFATFGDYGQDSINELNVSTMVKSWNPDFLATLGDHNYSSDYAVGSPSWTARVGNYYGEYILGRADNRYPEQSSPVQRFFPSPGNHDSGPDVGNGGEHSGYFDYFYSNPGGIPRLPTGIFEPMLTYYKMTWGNMDLYFFDSDNAVVNASALTVQRQWLKEQLAASTAQWKFAFCHHPPYSSGGVHGSQVPMQWGQDYQGLTAMFCGHEHIYERLNIGFGVTQFISGLGGRSIYSMSTPVAQSLFRYNTTYGAMKVRAGSAGVLFEFRAIGTPGGTLIDSYTIGTPPGQAIATGTDTWSLRVQPGQTFRLYTETPAAPGTLTNTANTALQLLDHTGTIVAADTGSAPDAINASLLYTVPAIPDCPLQGCLWTLKVYNESSGSGEYHVRRTAPSAAELYDLWAAARLPAGSRAAEADSDSDGAPNAMEYLANTDPVISSATPPLSLLLNAGGNPLLHLDLPDAWSRPVTVRLQSSTTLAAGSWTTLATRSAGTDWTPGGPAPAPGGGFRFTPAAVPRSFYRLAFHLE